MALRVYDKQGKRIWYDGVLEGNCPKCGQSLENIAVGIHKCIPPRHPVIFRHSMSGRRQFGGVPIQEAFCAICNKIWSRCDCPR